MCRFLYEDKNRMLTTKRSLSENCFSKRLLLLLCSLSSIRVNTNYCNFLSSCFCSILLSCMALVSAVMAGDGIDEAISQGQDYLLSQVQRDGSWRQYGHVLGETSLAGLAICMADNQRNPTVRKSRSFVRSALAQNSDTYDVSLAIMFLDAMKNVTDRNVLRQAGIRVAQGQLKNGAWSYGVPGPGVVDFRNTLAGGDNSCTQFAALASWVSRRHGVQNDPSLRQLNHFFRSSFNASSRGWGYTANSSATPSMTCAGLLGLAAARGIQDAKANSPENNREQLPEVSRSPFGGNSVKEESTPKQETQSEPALEESPVPPDPIVQEAFAYLGEQLEKNPSLANDHYFLWSLERVCVIYGAQTIGGVDWYQWGASRLLETQNADGSWKGKYSKTVDTSFALLFLTKANIASDLTAKVSGSGDPARPAGGGGGNQFFQRKRKSSAAKVDSKESQDQQNAPAAVSPFGAE